ncbi:MAG: hypothetical protein SFZ23_06810 [Planctomycetota bacterium]|nr:hypothetical protein [Planctomycetota bacterium]
MTNVNMTTVDMTNVAHMARIRLVEMSRRMALVAGVATSLGASSALAQITRQLEDSPWGPIVRQTDEATGEVRVIDQLGRAALITPGQAPEGGFQQRAPGDWTAIGPFGGDVQDVTMWNQNSNIVLAGTAPTGGFGGNLFRSTNNGITWTAVPQLAGRSVFDIEVVGNGTIWLGTQDSLFRSTDGGLTFTAVNLNIGANDQVYSVEVDPANAQVIWVGVAESSTQTVLLSTNGGTTWTNLSPPIANQGCRSIALDPANPGHVYAAMAGAFGGGSLWFSSDNGATWNNRSAGLPNNPMNDVLVVGPRVFVAGGQLFGGQNLGLYVTDDRGLTWNLLSASWPVNVANDVQVDALNPSVLYVATPRGVHKSLNQGNTWQLSVGGTSLFSCNSVDAFANNNVFVGASSFGVLRSVDLGATFDIASNGISELNVFSIASNPQNAAELAIAFQGLNDGGVYASINQGQGWAAQAVPATRWNTVKFSPTGVLHALSDGPTTIAPEALYRRNANNTWTALGPDQGTLFESELQAILFSGTNPNLIMLGGNDFGVAGFEATAWRSTNAGGAWTKEYEGVETFESLTAMAFRADGTEQTVLASVTDTSASTGGSLRSTDNGDSWTRSDAGLPAANFRGTDLTPVAGQPDTFYMSNELAFNASAAGLWKTTDAGLSWTSLALGELSVRVLGDPRDPDVLYSANRTSRNIRLSEDAGATFVNFSNGLGGAGNFQDLEFAGAPLNRILLATSRGAYLGEPVSACRADFNNDGQVDFFDFLDFASAFGNDEPSADFDGNGQVDFFDYLDFGNEFANCDQ